MITFEDVEDLWQAFDEADEDPNGLILIEKVLRFICTNAEVPIRDREMYEGLRGCVRNGGFLTEEEKKFLINYAILLVNPPLNATNQMRDSSSVLDVWPKKNGKNWWAKEFNDLALGVHRKEAFLWFIRMYEVLGNTFLHKRNYADEFYGLELARVLEVEKCRLREKEYALVAEFLKVAESLLTHDVEIPYDEKQTLAVMHKLIWKIKLGITKYS